MFLCSFIANVIFWLRLTSALDLNGAGIGVKEQAKVWSILGFLIQGEQRSILVDLYPFVTGLEDYESDIECEDCDLPTIVSGILSTEYGMKDIAALLPIYSNLYPMGMLKDDHDTSNESRFVLNGKQYVKSDDVFYLKSKELQKQAEFSDLEVTQPNEVIIGNNKEAPIVILYGCPDEAGEFEEFNRNLYNEATTSGKLRYIWRSSCPLERSHITGVPVSFTLRNQSSPAALPIESLDVPEEFTNRLPSFETPTAEELSGIDLKVAKLVADHYFKYRDFHSTLSYAKGIINNLPLLLQQLAKLDTNTSEISKSNERLSDLGISYDMLGIYVNGQNMRLSEVDRYNLLSAVVSEYLRLSHLGAALQTADKNCTLATAKQLLQEFSRLSLPNLEELQPIKVDLHRIPGFSESVIYFNDIEQDGQYDELGTEIQKFFDKSKFGEIPEYRQNWNEVIFVIDFGRLDDQEAKYALDGLNRALKAVAQGYPQRVGLLPLNTGSAEGIINDIYRLKDKDLNELMEFLETFPSPDFSSKSYDKAPNYSRILNELQIHETSIIVNGEIYPFKKNSWHYLIAKVMKKDKAFLKKELLKFGSKKELTDIDVRGLLHLRSSNTRHGKYAPDYFVDSSYTSLDNSVLQLFGGRVLEYTKGKDYLALHTVTLFDDFSCSQALERYKHILETSFVGVRVRIIHRGSLKDHTWNKLKIILSNELDMAQIDSLIKTSKTSYSVPEVSKDDISRWLVDFSDESLSDGAFLVVNGRFIILDNEEVPSKNQFEAIIKREAKRTLDTLKALEIVCPSTLEGEISPDFTEMVSATLTKLFYHGAQLYNNGIDYTPEGFLPRINVNLEFNNFTVFESHSDEKPVDVSLFLDPTEERSQTLLSLVTFLEPIPFVNLRIVLLPTEDLKITPVNRIYLDDSSDVVIEEESKKEYQVELDVPSDFYVTNTSQLDGVIVEVHAFKKGELISESKIDGVGGVCLELVDPQNNVVANCITMTTFGYGQLRAKSLGTGFSIRSCDPRFRVTSFASNGRSDYVRSTTFPLLSLNKAKVHVEVEEISGAKMVVDSDSDEMHIFTILKDNGEDEEKTQKMIISVLLNAKNRKVKFWILDQAFLTKSFKEFCQRITQSTDFEGSVEFIKYKWPLWLRPQRFSDRRMDLYKVLFVDVIFPQNVSQILYMEPDSSPIDPTELYDEEVSLPFSLLEASGPGYWDSGYWAKTLQERRVKFHTTDPAFLINLQNLRKLEMGDKLRIHYQRLSADRNSLINAAQDLLNDLQVEVPINTLSPLTKSRLKVDDEEVALWLDGGSFEEELNEELAAEELRGDLIHDEL